MILPGLYFAGSNTSRPTYKLVEVTIFNFKHSDYWYGVPYEYHDYHWIG